MVTRRFGLLAVVALFAALLASTATSSFAQSQGAHSVNPDGSFGYRIPIEVPPGIRGVQPNLALVYNSNAGNGMLGMGWSLEGLPVITRMNWGRGVNYDGLDTYTGPAGRLVQLPDGTYHSADETWGRYESSGQCGPANEPCSWVLTDKSGNKWHFGTTLDSRIEAVGRNGAVRVWALNAYEDVIGNSYTISYTNESMTGAYYPAVISYPPVTVNLLYLSRPDPIMTYDQSAYVRMQNRLSQVQVQVQQTLTRTYEIDYDPNADINGFSDSRIQTIRVEGQDGATQVLASVAWKAAEQNLNLTLGGNGAGLNGGVHGVGIRNGVADLFGDGKPVYWSTVGNCSFGVSRLKDDGTFQNWTFGTGCPAAITSQPISAGGTHGVGTITGIADVFGDGHPVYYTSGNCQFGFTRFYPNGTFRNYIFGTGCPAAGAGAPGTTGGTQGVGTFTGFADVFGDGHSVLYSSSTGSSCTFGFTRFFPNGTFQNSFYGTGCPSAAPGGPRTAGGTHGIGTIMGFADAFGDGHPLFYSSTNSSSLNCTFGLTRFNAEGTFQNFSYGTGCPSAPVGSVTTAGGTHGVGNLSGFADFFGDGHQLYYSSPGNCTFGLTRFIANGSFENYLYGQGCPGSPGGAPITQGGTHGGGTFNGTADFYGSGRHVFWSTAGQCQFGTTRLNPDGTFQNGLHGAGCLSTPSGVPFVTGGGTLGLGQAKGLVDLFGTGRQAYWTQNNNGWLYTTQFASSTPLLIAQITNSSGATITPHFALAGRVENALQIAATSCGGGSGTGHGQVCGIPMPATRQLVVDVETSDGRGQTISTTYSYFNGRTYPGTIQERADLGFEKVTSTNEQTGYSTTTFYRQDKPFHTRPMVVEVRNGSGQLVSRDTFDYTCPTGPAPLVPSKCTTAGQTTLVQATETTHQTYEAGVAAHYTRTHGMQYDAYGNLTNSIQCFGNGALCTSTDLTTAVAYDTTGYASGIYDRVQSVVRAEGTNKLDGTKFTYAANKLSLKERLYCEDATACPTGLWVPVEQGHQYDTYGNLTSVSDGLSHTKTFTYDPTSRFVATESQTVGSVTLSTSRTYDAFGRVLTSTDANGNETEFTYDGLGRKTGESYPNGGSKVVAYINLGSPTAQHVQTTNPDGTVVKSYLDGLGREYRRERTGDDGKTIVTTSEVTYNTAGQKVVTTSSPFFSSGSASDYTVTKLDGLGREVEVTQPGGSNTVLTYGPGTRTVTDANNHVTTQTFDARGKLTRVTDANNKQTNYTYDAMGRLVSVSLPGNIIPTLSFTYDSFGRKTSQTDMSTGLTAFEYDVVGNLVGKTDALSRTTSYTYDAANRLLTKTQGADTTWFVNDSQARPAGPPAGGCTETGLTNGVGRLTLVVEPNGNTTCMAYNTVGQMSGRTVSFSGLTAPLFSELWQYDGAGRLEKHTLPDGSYVRSVYSAGGNQKDVLLCNEALSTGADCTGTPPLATEILMARYSDFNPAGQVQNKVTQPNDPQAHQVTTTYSYSPRGLLQGLNTITANSNNNDGHTELQDLTYAFDGVGNVAAITDTRGFVTINDIDTTESQSFTYDNLDRLVTANGYYNNYNPANAKAYAYDDIGNLTAFGGVQDKHLTYDGQQAVDSTDSDFTATYDAAGNLVQKFQGGITWNYTYDADNRLKEVHKSGTGLVLSLTYNWKGERVKKVYQYGAGSTTTYYVGREYEERQNSAQLNHKRTLHVVSARYGKIASVTEEITGAVAHNGNPRSMVVYAGMFDAGTPMGFFHKAKYLTLAFLERPELPGQAIRATVGSAVLMLLVAGLLAIWRGRKRPTRTYPASLRLGALTVASAFLLVGCGGDGSLRKSSASGRLPPLNAEGQPPYYGPVPFLVEQDPQNGPLQGTWFYHNTHIGSSAVVTSQIGEEATRFLYMPYGEIDQAHSNGGYSVTHDFTSQERDPESELMYYRARYYDPSIGRFLTADTVIPGDMADPEGFGRYAYVKNNPINYTDPTGHSWLSNAGKKLRKWRDDTVRRNRKGLHMVVAVAAVVASYYATSACGGISICGSMASAFVSGVGHSLVEGRSLNDALDAGFQSAKTSLEKGAQKSLVEFATKEALSRFGPMGSGPSGWGVDTGGFSVTKALNIDTAELKATFANLKEAYSAYKEVSGAWQSAKADIKQYSRNLADVRNGNWEHLAYSNVDSFAEPFTY